MKCVRIRIYGRVQMVGFRYFTFHHALSLGLTGYVTNRVDGSVEVVASGAQGALNEMYAILSEGPRLARVENMEMEEIETPDTFEEFTIL
ncbi:MAG: acylphosphatase [Sphaerochaetaceae bacterium]|nr:acylphosphatase [Sphaerochaetaceae bacterium]